MALQLRVTRSSVALTVGRLFLRTWRPYAWLLPSGYISPQLVCMVEWVDDRKGSEGEVTQMGAFTSEAEAQALMADLVEQGWTNLRLNYVSVHERVSDWMFDR